MRKSVYNNIAVIGHACCAPMQRDDLSGYRKIFGDETVDKFSQTTGVHERRIAVEKQAASDLAFQAAEALLTQKGIDRDDIGVLVFSTESPDYRAPSTAFVLQARLKLPLDCICFDINLGCSAYIHGVNTAASLLATSNAKYALLLFGDTMTKYIAPEDKASCMLFGDAAGATLFEKKLGAPTLAMACKSDGYNFRSAIIPAGARRNGDAPHEMELWADGNVRSDYNFFMDGVKIFTFSTSEVPKFINAYMQDAGETEDAYDGLVLHQANAFIIKRIAKRLNFPMERVPISIDRFGNTSCSSIPLTMADAYAGQDRTLRLLLCGFGVGLSWGCVEMVIDGRDILPMLYSDDYFTGGAVSHQLDDAPLTRE